MALLFRSFLLRAGRTPWTQERRKLMTPSKAKIFVSNLEALEKQNLLDALSASIPDPPANAPLESSVLRSHFAHSALPFVGFGFLDNFIMIVAGEYIDHTLGSALCISTMAAAALGNTISDVFGVGSAWYVEHYINYFLGPPPALSSDQLSSTPCKIASNFGRTFGIIIGCIIGMAPLLFISDEDEKEDKKAQNV